MKNAGFTTVHFSQDDIPELQEFFLVNITSAVLITTLARLGTCFVCFVKTYWKWL